MEKVDVSPVNNFAIDERLLLRSFMCIRKKIGLKIEPWVTPANTGDHKDTWSFIKTR